MRILSTGLAGLALSAMASMNAANAHVVITVTEGTNELGVDGVTFSYNGRLNPENASSTSRGSFNGARFSVDPQAGRFANSRGATFNLRFLEDGSFLEDAGFEGFGSGPGRFGFGGDPSLSGGAAFSVSVIDDTQIGFGGDIQTIDIVDIGIPGFLEFSDPETPFSGFLTLPDETLASLGLAAGSFGFTLSSGESVTFEIDGDPVPLPAAAPLFLAGLGGLGLYRRFRRG